MWDWRDSRRTRCAFGGIIGYSQVQFSLVLPVVEVAKQQACYPQKFSADPYLLNRIRQFDEDEAAAWNLAMGFVFERITRFRVQAEDQWAFLFLRASDGPLPPDRYGDPSLSRLLRPVSFGTRLDRYHLIDGFHAPEGDRSLEGGFRWTHDVASVLVPSAGSDRLSLGTSRPAGARAAIQRGMRQSPALRQHRRREDHGRGAGR